MAEYSNDVQKKIQRVLGITPEALKAYDAAELVDELCETAIMLDEGNVVAQLTALREKLTAINGRIWNLLGQHDAKKARENLSGIAELERYVGELKRRSGEGEQAQGRSQASASEAEARQGENDERLRALEGRVDEIQEDLQSLFHTVMEIEELEEQVRSAAARLGAAKASESQPAAG